MNYTLHKSKLGLDTVHFNGGEAERSLLEKYNIIYSRPLLNGTLFTEFNQNKLRVYFGTGSLFLLDNQEMKTMFKIKKLTSSMLDLLTVEKLLRLTASQRVVKEEYDFKFYEDETMFPNDISTFASDYCTKAGVTNTTSRYFSSFVRGSFSSILGKSCILTNQGSLFTAEGLPARRKTLLNQLKKLVEKDLITFKEIARGEAVIKFNSKALNYNRAIAPRFFDALIY